MGIWTQRMEVCWRQLWYQQSPNSCPCHWRQDLTISHLFFQCHVWRQYQKTHLLIWVISSDSSPTGTGSNRVKAACKGPSIVLKCFLSPRVQILQDFGCIEHFWLSIWLSTASWVWGEQKGRNEEEMGKQWAEGRKLSGGSLRLGETGGEKG